MNADTMYIYFKRFIRYVKLLEGDCTHNGRSNWDEIAINIGAFTAAGCRFFGDESIA